MRFIGIWFNLDQEVKRDEVEAKDSSEASNKLHAMYYGKPEPGYCLSVVPKDGYAMNPGTVRTEIHR